MDVVGPHPINPNVWPDEHLIVLIYSRTAVNYPSLFSRTCLVTFITDTKWIRSSIWIGHSKIRNIRTTRKNLRTYRDSHRISVCLSPTVSLSLQSALFNKLTSVSYVSVLLLMMIFVITLSKLLWIDEALPQCVIHSTARAFIKGGVWLKIGAGGWSQSIFFSCSIRRTPL